MNVLYGVVGEGMGHAMRSRVLLEHLLSQGHQVQVMASGRAHGYLAKRFDGVNQIHGLHLIVEENRVRLGRTIWSNVLSGLAGIPKNIAAYFDLIRDFRPTLVVSDFESWTYLYGKMHGLPVLSVDNQQFIARCRHPDEIIAGHESSFQLTKTFVKSKLPYCAHYMVTTFVRPEVRKPDTTLYPPILRPEILNTKTTRGEHLLVYQTQEGNTALADTLKRTKLPCRIYGMKRNIESDEKDGNLIYRPFSELTFIEDLASCKAVIANAGFTLMGECVYMKKPMLAVALEDQFEQIINARYLHYAGYGQCAASLLDPAQVADFVQAIPSCEAKLATYSQDGNRGLLRGLDGFLDRAEAGVL